MWVFEELGLEVRIECLLETAHFYRGEPAPENEMVWVVFGCSVADSSDLTLSDEHSEYRWVTAEEAVGFLPSDHWLAALISRAEPFRKLMRTT